jgi:hypothetical protein
MTLAQQRAVMTSAGHLYLGGADQDQVGPRGCVLQAIHSAASNGMKASILLQHALVDSVTTVTLTVTPSWGQKPATVLQW